MRLQAAIAALQHTSTARVIAIRQEAGRWVAQANGDAEDAKAARIKAEAELEEEEVCLSSQYPEQ